MRKLAQTVIIAVVFVLEVIPLLWLLMQSLKGPTEFSLKPIWSLPDGLYLDNYAQAWNAGIGTYFMNSVLVVFPSLVLILILGVGAAFAIEIMHWRGRNWVLFLFVGGILVPAQIVLLPLFTIFYQTKLIDTRWALLITYTGFGLPLTIFLMSGYFKAVSRDILEAAVIDGANVFQVFFRVALPMVANAVITVALVQFFFLWNDLLFTLTFISDDNLRTIQTGLLQFNSYYGSISWGPVFAATCIAVFPTLLIYLVLNRQVIKGLTAGAVKG